MPFYFFVTFLGELNSVFFFIKIAFYPRDGVKVNFYFVIERFSFARVRLNKTHVYNIQ
ncbi:hypothetical protein BD770DRAFT_386429 [Pilaira anomala]|nr:hypothetical protein BD770DRAFT_386429 [Pilaira anomala]